MKCGTACGTGVTSCLEWLAGTVPWGRLQGAAGEAGCCALYEVQKGGVPECIECGRVGEHPLTSVFGAMMWGMLHAIFCACDPH